MNRIARLLALLLPLIALARSPEPLTIPITPRTLGLAGAYVALADDPAAGYLNPGGLRTMKQIGYDLFYGSSTSSGQDQIGVFLSNPGTEQGATVAMGAWAQGWTRSRRIVYFVPYSGTSFDLTSATHLGLVLRTPYVWSHVSGIGSHWETLGDVTLLQSFESLHLGAAMERAVGGGAEFIPRRLRLGGAFLSSSSGVAVSYEWQGNEGVKSYRFVRSSSHYGAEIPVSRYAIIRGGYVAGPTHRVAFGMTVGNLKAGWRIEGGWELPAAEHGDTRWVVGMGYRI
jgi:hypothetical protein